jgi:hypothetical protein
MPVLPSHSKLRGSAGCDVSRCDAVNDESLAMSSDAGIDAGEGGSDIVVRAVTGSYASRLHAAACQGVTTGNVQQSATLSTCECDDVHREQARVHGTYPCCCAEVMLLPSRHDDDDDDIDSRARRCDHR